MSRYNQNHHIVLIPPETGCATEKTAPSSAPSERKVAETKKVDNTHLLNTATPAQEPCCNLVFQANLTNYGYTNYYVNQYTSAPAHNVYVNDTHIPVQPNPENTYITAANIQDPNTTCLYSQQYYNAWASDPNLNAYSTVPYTPVPNFETEPNIFNVSNAQVYQCPCCDTQNFVPVDNTCVYMQQYSATNMPANTPVMANKGETNDMKNNDPSPSNETITSNKKERIKLNLINSGKVKTSEKMNTPSESKIEKSNYTERDSIEKLKPKEKIIKTYEEQVYLEKKTQKMHSSTLNEKEPQYKSINKTKCLENSKKSRITTECGKKPIKYTVDKITALKSKIHKNIVQHDYKDKNISQSGTVTQYRDVEGYKRSEITPNKIYKSVNHKTDIEFRQTKLVTSRSKISERTKTHEKGTILKRKKTASPETVNFIKSKVKSVNKDIRLSESRTSRIQRLKQEIEKIEKLKKNIKGNIRSKTKPPESEPNISATKSRPQDHCADYDMSLDEYMKLKRKNLRESNLMKTAQVIPQDSELRRLRADENIDLRSTLSRKRSRQESQCSSSTQGEKIDRENLVVTIKQDVNTGPTSPAPVPTKLKQNRHKKIKLVINVFCEESTSSDSDENPATRVQQRNELSFLDDFNIDEIVDSLNNGTETDQIVKRNQNCEDRDNAFESSSNKTPVINELLPKEIIIKSESIDKLADCKCEDISGRSPEDLLHVKLEKLFGSDCEDEFNTTIEIKECSNSMDKDITTTCIKEELIQSSKSHDNNMSIENTENSADNVHSSINACDIKPDVDSNCDKLQLPECSEILPAGQIENVDSNDFVLIEAIDEPIIISDDEDCMCADNQQTANATEKMSHENEIKNVNNTGEIEKTSDNSLVSCSNKNKTVEVTEQNETVPEINEDLLNTAKNIITQNIEENSEEIKDTNCDVSLNENIIDSNNHYEDEQIDNISVETVIIMGNDLNENEECTATTAACVQNDDDIVTVIDLSEASITKGDNENLSEKTTSHKTETKHENSKDEPKPEHFDKTIAVENEKANNAIESVIEICEDEISNPGTSNIKSSKDCVVKVIALKHKVLPMSKDKGENKIDPLEEKREVNKKQTVQKTVACAPKREVRIVEDKKEIRKPKTNTERKIGERAQDAKGVEVGSVHLKSLSISELNFVYKLDSRISDVFKDRYRITALIASGRYSEVYKCVSSNRESCAVKVLKKPNDRLCRGLFKAKMFSRLQAYDSHNSALVFMIHSFHEKGHWCFLFDYYPMNLEQALLENKKCFHINVVQLLARQLVDAVTMLSNNAIVHTDIKPKHILLNSTNDKLKLAGFDESSYIENLNVTSYTGTPNYRAPEIILGFPADYGIDVWSTALVIYEMATGIKLFPGKHNNDILYKQMCTLGKISEDMILNCSRRSWHFSGTTFTRLRETIQYINYFQRSNRIVKTLFGAYKVHWQPFATKQEVYEDKVKIKSLETLLLRMLVLDPRLRLPITLVGVSEFLHSLFYTDM